MSDTDNMSDRNSGDNNEHFIFVSLLPKYRILLDSQMSWDICKKKRDAATEFLKEYNPKCSKQLTVDQCIKKVRNMKSRLKAKRFKNSCRGKKLEYLDWERMLLDLLIESGLPIITKKSFVKSKGSKNEGPENEMKAEPGDDSLQNSSMASMESADFEVGFDSPTIKPEEIDEDNDVRVKIEADDSISRESCQLDTDYSNHVWEVETESETTEEDEITDEEYKSMSLERLKRAALIAQIKSYKQKERAARAKKKLKLYKLSLLKKANLDEI